MTPTDLNDDLSMSQLMKNLIGWFFYGFVVLSVLSITTATIYTLTDNLPPHMPPVVFALAGAVYAFVVLCFYGIPVALILGWLTANLPLNYGRAVVFGGLTILGYAGGWASMAVWGDFIADIMGNPFVSYWGLTGAVSAVLIQFLVIVLNNHEELFNKYSKYGHDGAQFVGKYYDIE